jgi:hypothetical protein
MPAGSTEPIMVPCFGYDSGAYKGLARTLFLG